MCVCHAARTASLSTAPVECVCTQAPPARRGPSTSGTQHRPYTRCTAARCRVATGSGPPERRPHLSTIAGAVAVQTNVLAPRQFGPACRGRIILNIHIFWFNQGL